MSHHRQALGKLMRQPQDQIDLAEAALLVARERYPDLDFAPYLKALDELAETVRGRLRPSSGPGKILQTMNAHLFEELGFHGNEQDYDDPRNSFLNDVLTNRTGIPITLCIVYMEVARRLGVVLYGVGMPGHFLVKFPRREGEVVMDPFHRGVALSAGTLRDRIQEAGGSPELAGRYLSAMTKRQIVTRLLNNLKQCYWKQSSFDEALGIVELILAVNPWDLDEIRNRGLIQRERGALSSALRDLETYIEYRADAEDAASMREEIEALRPSVSGQE